MRQLLYCPQLHGTLSYQQATSPVWKGFSAQNYQWFRAMTFAIEEINGSTNLLPNITLGFWIYDSCMMRQLALQGTFWLLTGQQEAIPNYRCCRIPPLAGIVGDGGSSNSMVMARVLSLYRTPQISYLSTNSLLSDRHQFPSFFRTIPSDDFQSRGLAQLVIHFGWNWVGLLADDNDYGQQGIQVVKQELLQSGACIAFSENIVLNQADRNALHIVRVIISSTADAIVIFALDTGLAPLLNELALQNVTQKVWIASEGWSTSSLFSIKKYRDLLTGTIGFAVHHGEMPGFQEHFTSIQPSSQSWDIFVSEFWEVVFGCQWKIHGTNTTVPCTGTETLDDLPGVYDATNLRITYNAYSAVYAMAMALHNLSSCRIKEGPFSQGACSDILYLKPWQCTDSHVTLRHCKQYLPEKVFHYLKNLNFQAIDGRVVFLEGNRSPFAQYDIVNWQRGAQGILKHTKVGGYDSSGPPGGTLTVNNNSIQWAAGKTQVPPSVCSPSCHPGFRRAAKQGEPLCCFQCVPCPIGEISNQTDSAECTKCPPDHWSNTRQDICIAKTTEFLSFKEPLGVILATSTIFCSLVPLVILAVFIYYWNTPIVKANNRSLSYLLLLSLTLCFVCSLAFIGYPTAEKCLLRQPAFGISFALCVSCILAKTITVVIAFNSTKPNHDLRRCIGPKFSYTVIGLCTLSQVLLCIFWLILSPPFSETNNHTQPGKIIIECNEGSPLAFWCMLGYLGILATICFFLAFLARKLPDSFNEAKFITFSMLAFLSVWFTFVPAYLSTRDKFMVAMEIFAILASSSSLLSCIFFPKCYIILWKPNINSKKYLLSKSNIRMDFQKHGFLIIGNL
ncbi:extracellular calcium-sensing receptor-like [Ambystoma mexicanum]|uniref:extracellular calcium-sensing receptor-like n=1 Tax=Ambystoma mexicanum TaxID=8296 RepID=UPI0037E768BA